MILIWCYYLVTIIAACLVFWESDGLFSYLSFETIFT